MRIALILSIALLTGCIPERIGGNGITVIWATFDDPTTQGQWQPQTKTIALRWFRERWTLAHEIGHASDAVGGYRAALGMVGDLPSIREDLTIAYKVATLADTMGGTPQAYWKALGKMYGQDAVQHQWIINKEWWDAR